MYDYLRKGIITLSALGMTLSPLALHKNQVQADESLKVGVIQYVEHESLDQNYQGFVDGLKEAGYEEGKNLELNYVNAAGDNTNLQSMSESVGKNSDYLFAIATPVAQALANIEKEKPIYISSVTDPVSAGLVESLEKPNTNVTGTIDAGPLKEQVALISQVAPNAKKVGLIYNSGEANSVSEAKLAKKELEAAGYQVAEQTVTSTNDISQVMQSLVADKVDALFTVTDNTIASAMTLVGDMAIEAKLPLVGGSKDMVLNRGLVTYGLDYYELGKQTAKMLVDQVKSGKDTKDIPIQTAAKLDLVVNKDVAQALGIDPESIKTE